MRILGFSQRVLQPIDGCLAAFDGQYCARTFSDDTRSLNFVEDRAPIETADQESCMSSEGPSLDRVQAAPFFVPRSAP